MVVVAVAGCGGGARYHSTRGAQLLRFALHSRLTHRDLHEMLVVPRRHGYWLLVLLHGKGGSPSQFLSQPFFDTLAGLGRRAPDVLLLDGGDDSYWHNRKDGRWGSMVLREAIPTGLKRTHAGESGSAASRWAATGRCSSAPGTAPIARSEYSHLLSGRAPE